MRLAYVCADGGVPVFGHKGCSVHVMEVVRAMIAEGYSVDLFATRFGGSPPADLRGIRTHRLSARRSGRPADRERYAIAANEPLLSQLRREGPFDLVYERYSLWSFAGMEFARWAGVPGIMEVNSPLVDEQARHRQLIDRPTALETTQRAFQAASLLIAVSDEVAEYARRQSTTNGRVRVVCNGVNPDSFPDGTRPTRSGGPDTFTVGFVGSLKPWHGLESLVEAFIELFEEDPTYRLLIVGDGPQRAGLEDGIRARGSQLAEAVHFSGAVAPEDVAGFVASMDVATAPYDSAHDFYFSPLKVYEYMAAGRAIVAGSVGQLESVLEDGVNGLLCAPGNVNALVSAIGRLRNDPQLCRNLGERARADALDKHTWRARVEKILSFAHSVEPVMSSSAEGAN